MNGQNEYIVIVEGTDGQPPSSHTVRADNFCTDVLRRDGSREEIVGYEFYNKEPNSAWGRQNVAYFPAFPRVVRIMKINARQQPPMPYHHTQPFDQFNPPILSENQF